MISIEEFQKKGQNLLVDRRAGERGVGVEGKQVEETPDELLLDGGGDGDAACDKKQSGQLRESRTRWTIRVHTSMASTSKRARGPTGPGRCCRARRRVRSEMAGKSVRGLSR